MREFISKHTSALMVVTTLLLAITSPRVTASEDVQDQFGIGFQGGITFSSMTTPSGTTSASRTGFILGMLLDFPIVNYIYISPEANFVQRGSTLADSNGVSINAYSDSVEIPILLKVKFLEKVRPYIFAGPNFIFNFDNAITATNVGSISYNPQTFDFAVDFGVGVELGLFIANIRYAYGLVNVSQNSSNWSSRGFQALVGIRL